ncbi:MAG: VWA domain-containing protein [Deltaproteobacteria bacterium]|nr:VWA domain-containing protein [Deltaproteobacteria bacterium]
MFRRYAWMLTLAAAPLLLGCPSRSFEIPPPKTERQTTKYYPQSIEKDVDLLFMIDNSGSMEQEQIALQTAFPKLIEALRSAKLGNKLPNIHIGVVSSDLGAGSYGLPSCEVSGGDAGKLQNKPRVAGCTAPSDAYISSIEGQTNIPNCKGDSVECVKEAFKCIASLGINGCGFEAQLESVRRALDPKLKLNPGFLREDAFLAIVFITDEDDCSARNPQLFDPQQQALTDPLGPLSSFRCFEFGIQCDVNDRNKTGARKNCVPAFDWLYKVDDYIKFFEGLKKSKDRIIMAAIAGPTPATTPKGSVAVGKDGQNPVFAPSCQGSSGFAVPALRIMSVVKAFDGQFASVCEPSKFPDALEALGKKIVASLGGQCIGAPLLLPNGGVACAQGVAPCKMPTCESGETCDNATGLCMKNNAATGRYCGKTCLDKVECLIYEVTGKNTTNEKRTDIKKCPAKYFLDPAIKKDACGADCPCWRLVPRPKDCTANLKVSPFGLEIMRKGDAAKGSVAEALCRSATFKWSDPEVQTATKHCSRLE